ncbi:Lrp/AsnC family transcriptional regulator [Halobellus rufus]|uniref:Lrp/AsnC family transcriptional regulator n=1 Tax=Halobellus rufus TaxID=1448860 RepID=UPI000678A268|nr:Lrp/AsnC family transcriptional regulator [Halobellus rufus]
MVHAFIMVKTGPGTSEQIVESIRGLANVAEAHIVAGAYDIIVEADAEAVYEILNAASNEIQGLTGVTETKTYIAME